MKEIADKNRWRQKVWQLAESINAERVAEIGVFRGHCSIGLAQLPCVKHLTLVDPWSEAHGPGSVTDRIPQKQWDALYDKVCSNAKEWEIAFETKIEVLRMTSAEAWRKLVNARFDLIYIDADHRAEAVEFDSMNWVHNVRRGGILCGDDYDKESVRRGLEWLGDTTRTIEEDRIWWLRL